MRYLLLATICFALLCRGGAGETVLIEAEQFQRPGGWVNDCQFMDQMGSPFLLAHGLGVPVADAETAVALPEAGVYRVWVRTRDWVATWQAPGTPGRFQLLVGGKPLPVTFGTEGAAWHWQDGGAVEVAGTNVKLALHDLSGFEGRCDAILMTTDGDYRPPDAGPALAALRRRLLGLTEQPVDAGQFDLVVTGGGIAGTCATLAAARLGLRVALIQDRPVVGGNNSSEIRVWLQGARNKEPYPHVGDIVRELEQRRRAHYGPKNTADLYEDDRKLALLRAEPNVALFLNHRANEVEMEGPRLRAVIAQDTLSGQRRRFAAPWFVDSTGDGCIGALAGADCELTLPGHMGRCNLWNVIDTGTPSPFPRCPWALDLSDKPFPGRDVKFPGLKRDRRGIEALGCWDWESGFDHNPFAKNEYIRDWNLRAMYGAWDTLKNVDKRYPNHKLNWAAYVSGKRESRRLLGDVILTKEDVLNNKKYPDGCVPTGWAIDLHLPHPDYVKGFEGDAFIAKAYYTHYEAPYWVPYRCLYSRSVPNLLMAGRDISVTHEALGTVRVMRTGGCMGEIVGMAASLCRKHDTDPRGVYQNHLADLLALMRRGVGKPPQLPELQPPGWLAQAGENLALAAHVTVSGRRDEAGHPEAYLNDGQADLMNNDQRWLSEPKVPHWIEFRWDRPQSISAVRVISGYMDSSGSIVAPVESFVLQVPDGDTWRDLEEVRVKDNTAIDWHARFPRVKVQAIRLSVTATRGDISRIWEIELYDPPG